MKMCKLSREKLSRLLGEHDAGQLKSGGGANWVRSWWDNSNRQVFLEPVGCLVQVVENISGAGEAAVFDTDAVGWFDRRYEKDWTPEQFLGALKRKGLA